MNNVHQVYGAGIRTRDLLNMATNPGLSSKSTFFIWFKFLSESSDVVSRGKCANKMIGLYETSRLLQPVWPDGYIKFTVISHL